ncbi:MAG: hypothetical protein J6V50_04515, partial [Clostridia bacterium]|nr:hypothetical protein [Clostridia bacterium]
NEANEYRNNLFNLQANDEINRKTKPNIALIIMSVILLLVAAVCFVIKKAFFLEGAALTLIGLIILIFGIFPPKKKQPPKIANEISNNQARLHSALFDITEVQKKLEEINLAINSAIAESGGKKALLEARQKEFLEKSEALIKAKSELLNSISTLTELCRPFCEIGNDLEIIDFIKNTVQDISAAEVMISMAADSTKCQSLGEAETRLLALDSDETLRGLTNETVAAAKDEYRRLAEVGAQLRGEIATLKSNLKVLYSSGETVPVLEQKINAQKESISIKESFCDATDIALSVLTDSFAAMREGYGGILEAETSDIFSKITGGAYSSLDISKDFEIKTHKEGVFGAKEWQFLSAGTADQAYLSLRIAISKLIDENLPLIMDDSLAQYDSGRATAALEFLSGYAKEHQLLLFTCHNDIKNKAESLGANSINM